MPRACPEPKPERFPDAGRIAQAAWCREAQARVSRGIRVPQSWRSALEPGKVLRLSGGLMRMVRSCRGVLARVQPASQPFRFAVLLGRWCWRARRWRRVRALGLHRPSGFHLLLKNQEAGFGAVAFEPGKPQFQVHRRLLSKISAGRDRMRCHFTQHLIMEARAPSPRTIRLGCEQFVEIPACGIGSRSEEHTSE